MTGYVLTPLAKADIFEIWSFIARQREEAADSVEQAIYDACQFVPKLQCVGIPVPGLRRVRFVSGR